MILYLYLMLVLWFCLLGTVVAQEKPEPDKTTAQKVFANTLYATRVIAESVYRNTALVLWRVFALGILFIVYSNVLARGLANAFVDLGTKLHKTPFLQFLAKYEETKNIPLAYPVSVIVLCVAFPTWEILLRMACGDDSMFRRFEKPENAKRFMVAVGSGILAFDFWCYYLGITNSGWGSVGFSFTALLSTIGFMCVNVAVCMFSVFLSPRGYAKGETKVGESK